MECAAEEAGLPPLPDSPFPQNRPHQASVVMPPAFHNLYSVAKLCPNNLEHLLQLFLDCWAKATGAYLLKQPRPSEGAEVPPPNGVGGLWG